MSRVFIIIKLYQPICLRRRILSQYQLPLGNANGKTYFLCARLKSKAPKFIDRLALGAIKTHAG